MCTLEFTDHQPIYRWYIEHLGIFPSNQTEFDRLNITYTMLSKRKLLQLVQENRVNGWDDPRMPTLRGLRRRGFTPEAIRAFVAASGVSRTNGSTDVEMLEHFQRDDLNRRASRAMAVLRPLKLVIDNYPADKQEFVEAANNPEDSSAGTRQVPFSREIYIEQDDFREIPPPKYYRLSPGKEVRLRNAYFVTAQSLVKDAGGNIVEVHCTYDPASRGGNSPDGRKVKSTMHWVSAAHAISAEIRLYDKLFAKADPYDLEEGQDVLDNLNANSLEILTGAKLEPSLSNAKLEEDVYKRQACAHADEHLNKIGARDRKKRHIRFAGHGTRQQRFAGSRRAHEQNALGNASAELLELRRLTQVVDDLLQLFLGLVYAGHLLESDLLLLHGEEARPALAERHRLVAAGLHLAHEEEPDADQKNERTQGGQQLQRDVALRFLLGEVGVRGQERRLKSFEVVADMGVELFLGRGLHVAVQLRALDLGVGYLPLFHLVVQVGVRNLRVLAPSRALRPHAQEHHEADEDKSPEQD